MLKVALVQCPAWWVEGPNYSLGLLASVLQDRGFAVQGFDLNLEMFLYYQGTPKASYWKAGADSNVWYLPQFVDQIASDTEPLLDAFIDRILPFDATVVGFCVQHMSAVFTNVVSGRLKARAPERLVVYGGPECFRNAGGLALFDTHPAVDAICLAEGERAFSEFLEHLVETGRPEAVPGLAVRGVTAAVDPGDPAPIVDLDELPFADFSIFPPTLVRSGLGLPTSRGCLMRCRFCSESPHWKRYRSRSAEHIVAEMAYQHARYPHVRYFHLNDSLINGDMRVLERFCDLIIARGLHVAWGGQALIRPQMTADILAKMRRAGCANVSYGLESGSNRILKAMGKPFKTDLAERVIRDGHAAGIPVILNIIVGFPGEGTQEFEETLQFVARIRPYTSLISFNTLHVLQGSELAAHPARYGIVMPEANAMSAGRFESDNPALEWWTADRTNTYAVRQERLNLLQQLVEDKNIVFNSKSDTLMILGDSHVKLGDLASALAAYRHALEECRDESKRQLVLERLRRIDGHTEARRDAA